MYRDCKMNVKKGEKKVVFELLASCNLHCSHCFYRSSSKFNSPDFLPKEEIFKIIIKMVKNGISKLILTGGEPTLHPDFIEISNYAMLNIPKVTICTNGVIQSDELEDEVIKQNFSTYTISLDSHIKEVHDKFRGKEGAFDRAVSFIKKLSLNKKNVSIHITIHPENIDHIEETIEFCKRFSRDIVVSSIYHNKLSGGNSDKTYLKRLKDFRANYLDNSEITLVGFTPYCESENCWDQKNIFTINRKGELISCYWQRNGGSVIDHY